MTNGGGQSQQGPRRTQLPPAFRTAETLHNDYLESLDEYKNWVKGREQKVTLWQTIRSIIINEMNKADDAWNGENEKLQNIMEALGVGSVSNASELSDAQRVLLAYSNLLENADETFSNYVVPDSNVIKVESLLRYFEDVKRKDQAPFFYFGWELLLRKILVEYHAQRLRVHLYGGLSEMNYPDYNWKVFNQHAADVKSGDADPVVRKLFEEYRSKFGNHSNLLNNPSGDSGFCNELAKIDSHSIQIDIMFQVTFALGSSFIGQRTLAELAWGYYGDTMDFARTSGGTAPYQRLRLADFFRERRNMNDPGKWVVNPPKNGPSGFIGVNQDTLKAFYFAIQIAPGYHRAIGMAKNDADISKSDLKRIERDAATVLAWGAQDPAYTSDDVIKFPSKAKQNMHSREDALKYLQFPKKLTQLVAASENELILDWAKKAGIKKAELGIVRSGGYTLVSIRDVPDHKIVDKLEEVRNGGDDFSKAQVESTVALKRCMLLFKTLSHVFALALAASAGERNDDDPMEWTQVSALLKAVGSSAELLRSVQGEKIQWEKISMKGSTRNAGGRPVKYVEDLEEIKSRLSSIRSRVKTQLKSDLAETVRHLDKLEATINTVEWNLSKKKSRFDLDRRHLSSIRSDLRRAKLKVRSVRATAENYRKVVEANDPAKLASIFKEADDISKLKVGTETATAHFDTALSRLAENVDSGQLQPPSETTEEMFARQRLISPAWSNLKADRFKSNGRGPYSKASQVADIDSIPATKTANSAFTRLDDFASIEITGSSDQLAKKLATSEGVEETLRRMDEYGGWFARQGDGDDLQYLRRTTDMMDEGVPYKPKRLRFTTRIVVGSLFVVGDCIDIYFSYVNMKDAISVNDHSAAVGSFMSIVGTGVLLFASGMAAWVAGAAVLVGTMLVVLTSDTNVTKWIRHTYFGSLWHKPMHEPFETEYARWGTWLRSVVGKASADASESGDSSVFQQLQTYTNGTTDADMKRYFAAQVAWTHEQHNPLDIACHHGAGHVPAKLVSDADGFPAFRIELDAPDISYRSYSNNYEFDTFRFGSILVMDPGLFAKKPDGDRVFLSRDPFLVELSPSMMINYDKTYTKIEAPEATEDEIVTKEDTFNTSAEPIQAASGDHYASWLEYKVTLNFGGFRTWKRDPERDGVWIKGVTVEIGFRDAFKKKYRKAYKADKAYHKPLNYLVGLYAGSGTAPELSDRLSHGTSLSGDLKEKFKLPNGDVILDELGIEVHHLSPELAKAAHSWAKEKGYDRWEMLRKAELNPFVTREGEMINVDGYPTDPPPWKENI